MYSIVFNHAFSVGACLTDLLLVFFLYIRQASTEKDSLSSTVCSNYERKLLNIFFHFYVHCKKISVLLRRNVPTFISHVIRSNFSVNIVILPRQSLFFYELMRNKAIITVKFLWFFYRVVRTCNLNVFKTPLNEKIMVFSCSVMYVICSIILISYFEGKKSHIWGSGSQWNLTNGGRV